MQKLKTRKVQIDEEQEYQKSLLKIASIQQRIQDAQKRKESEIAKRKTLAVEENIKYNQKLEQIQDFLDK